MIAGRYRIDGPLGSGGQAEVFRGYDCWLDRSVALKRCSDASPTSLRREYSLLRQVAHPSLVQALDLVNDDEGGWFLIEPLVEGESIVPWARWQSSAGVMKVLAPVAHALAHLHARRLVHGDVSPGNVLVTPEGRAVLLDLGLASSRSQGLGASGTPGFISPERLRDPSGFEPSADVWSLAAVMAAALGSPINEGSGTESIQPDSTRALIDECLRQSPGSRPSAMEVAKRATALGGERLKSLDRPLIRLGFVGREEERTRLEHLLQSRHRPVWVCGSTGSGKTALLETTLDAFRVRGATVVHISLSRVDAADALERRLRALDPSLFDATTKPSTLPEQAAALVLLADRVAAHRPLVIALDDVVIDGDEHENRAMNAEEAEEARGDSSVLMRLLAVWEARRVSSGPHVVVGARGRLESRVGVELGPLGVDSVREFFRVAYAEPRPTYAAAAIDLVGSIPADLIQLLVTSRDTDVTITELKSQDVEAPLRLTEEVIGVAGAVLAARSALPITVLRELVSAELLSRWVSEGILQRVDDGARFCFPRSVRERISQESSRADLSQLAQAQERARDFAGASTSFALLGDRDGWRRTMERVEDVHARRRVEWDGVVAFGADAFSRDALLAMTEEAAEQGEQRRVENAVRVLAELGAQRDTSRLLAHVAIKSGRHEDALAALEGAEMGVAERAVMARALFFLGRLEDALEEASHVPTEKSGRDAVMASEVAGHACIGLGRIDEGLMWLERALELVRSVSDARLKNRTRHSLAVALHRAGRLQSAREFYQESLAENEPNINRKANYAGLLQDAGEFDRSETLYRDCFEKAQQLADVHQIARVGINLANLLVTLGELAEAREIGEEVFRHCLQHGLTHAGVVVQLVLFEVAIESEHYRAARRHCESVREDIERIDDAVVRGEHVILEARLLVAESDVEGATKNLAQLQVPDVSGLAVRLAMERVACEVALPSEFRSAQRAEELAAAALRATEDAHDELRWRALAYHAVVASEPEVAVRSRQGASSALQRFLESLSAPRRATYMATRRRRELRSWLHADSVSSPWLGSEADKPYRRLLSLNRQLARESDVDKLLEMIVDAAIELLGAERGFILLAEDTGFHVAVARNLDRSSLDGGALRFSRSIAADVLGSGEAVVTTNAQNDARYADVVSVASNSIRSALCVPLRGLARSEDPLIGALYLDHRYLDRVFTEADVGMCAALADQVTIALENARLVTKVRTQEARLKESNRALEQANQSLRRDAARSAEAAEAALRRLREEGPSLGVGRGLEGIVGRSDSLRQTLRLVDRFADTDMPVIVRGESGTGKELIARALHERSDRRDARFVSVNCGAIPEGLLESELFGHVRGAFTGAHRDKPGLFAAAASGTLFLDEIAEMPMSMQVKLLRVLQESAFRPVGSNEIVASDARVVAATHRDLGRRVEEGRFREDLYYRLNVVEIHVAALRDRREDILPLVDHFCRTHGKAALESLFTPDALQCLLAYEWPGNVRELENEITRALALADGIVRPEDLSERFIRQPSRTPSLVSSFARGSLREIMESFEKEVLVLALERSNWNVRRTAKELGVSRAALYTRMTKFSITREQYAGDPGETH